MVHIDELVQSINYNYKLLLLAVVRISPNITKLYYVMHGAHQIFYCANMGSVLQ